MSTTNFQHYEKYLLDTFITNSDKYQALWADGEISIDRQLKDIDFVTDRNIFTVGHTMTQNTPFHRHDFYELIYVLKGSLKNVTSKKTIYMTAGNMCIMNLESSHSLEVIDKDAIVINIGIKKEEFNHGVFKEFLQANNYVSIFLRGEDQQLDYLYFPSNNGHTISTIIQSILLANAKSDDASYFSLVAYVLLLLSELTKMNEFSYFGIDDTTLEILNYIDAYYATTSLKDIAQQFNYNESYLSRFVKKHTGKQITKLITERRMENAALLLQNTEAPVNHIAEEVGYQSYSHFNKVFKSWFDCTPHEFRVSKEI